MNIAETIKEKCKDNNTTNILISVSKDFAINIDDTHNGLTFDFIDGSLLTIKESSIYPKGFAVTTQDKRA